MNMKNSAAPGLYIHIPFCKSRCAYCDFFSVTDTSRISCFLDALITEISLYRQQFTEFETIYIGGGTPSLLGTDQIEMLLASVRAAFTILPNAEITIEVNPADWKRKDFEQLIRLGINRINIGVQSLDDYELSFLGRRHTN